EGRARAEPAVEPVGRGGDDQRGQPGEERAWVPTDAPLVGFVPERCQVEDRTTRKDGPRSELGPRRRRDCPRAAHESHHPDQIEEGRPEEDAGARLVEAALDHGEGRYGETRDASDGELSEDEEVALGELRHAAALPM